MSEKLASMRFMAKRLDAEKRKIEVAAATRAAADAAWTPAGVFHEATPARAASGPPGKRRLVCVADTDSTVFAPTAAGAAELQVAATADGAMVAGRRSYGLFNAALERQARGETARPDVGDAEMAATLQRRGGVSAPPRRGGAGDGAPKPVGGDSYAGMKRPRGR